VVVAIIRACDRDRAVAGDCLLPRRHPAAKRTYRHDLLFVRFREIVLQNARWDDGRTV